ncbi:Hypothetical protein, putative [Bodo saltans]|uniref:Uncharacterized protein n=1 Tax=Bodo saltans TaxID=75058 RepID=A0A0S4JF10_BODSA|nr:Hypothetical protein, putative [Bodo saltans]|eukprot:CUG88704.1 Hypothetical protein, putative [Bodo saltans]
MEMDPSANEDFLIFNICQFAKHDQPLGTRAIMLKALLRIFSEVDPRQGGSMLLLCPEFMTLPLCDMIHKISLSLNPSRTQAPSKAPTSVSPPRSSPSKKHHVDPSLDSAAGRDVQQDRYHFVMLLRCLCDKVEQCNELASYFMFPNGKGSSTFLLLDSIVPYVYETAVINLPQEQRFETYSSVLRGVLSLAKSPGDAIQQAISERADIHFAAQDVLRAAFLTICKVPDHSEIRLQTACVMETMRWMEALLELLPVVAENWEVRKYLQQEFVCSTMLPIFRTPDERAYLAVATLVIHILKDALPPNSYIANLVTLALLQSRVGNEHQEIFLFYTKSMPSDWETSTRAFAEEYMWPRLSDISGDVVCATLQLLTALASRTPHFFMTHALKLDAVAKPLFFTRSYLEHLIETFKPERAPSPQPSVNEESVTSGGQLPLKRNLRQAVVSKKSGIPPSMSAVNPLIPNIVINDFFSDQLKIDKGLCGSSADDFVRDALQLILELDGALTPVEGLLHRTRVERFLPSKRAVSPQGGADVDPADARVTSPPTYCAGTAAPDQENVFFDPVINDAPLVVVCCELIKCILEHPFSVNALLSELITTLCALPDVRVLFTLLDPVNGKFALALKTVQERVATILAHEKRDFMNGNAASASRKALFERCAQRPYFDPADEAFGGDEAVASSMKASKVFVEACVCLEGLRHELNAVGAYQVVSQRFSELSPGIQRPFE